MKRRIDELGFDKKKNLLIHKLQNSPFFTIQCDESTDVGHCFQLLIYYRFINSISEGSDILSAINIFFDYNGFSWKNVVGVRTNGTPAMLLL